MQFFAIVIAAICASLVTATPTELAASPTGHGYNSCKRIMCYRGNSVAMCEGASKCVWNIESQRQEVWIAKRGYCKLKEECKGKYSWCREEGIVKEGEGTASCIIP